MVEIHAVTFLVEDTQATLCHSLLTGEVHLILLPVFAVDGNGLFVDNLVVLVNQFYTNLSRLAVGSMQTSIDREEIFHVFLEAHAEESVVVDTTTLLTMTGIEDGYIVRVAFESRAVGAQ